MNATKITEALKASRDYTTEVRHDALSVATLNDVASKLAVPPEALYVSVSNAGDLKLSLPGAKPIRTVPMGEKP